MSETTKAILSEIEDALESVPERAFQAMVERICDAPRIFVQGADRSGYIGRAFTMRLMQMGLPVFFVGDTTTPAIAAGDLLITISGSGKTAHLRSNVELASKLGASIYLITAHEVSPMAEIAESSIVIPGPTKMHATEGNRSGQLIGSLFEQSAFILCEAVVGALSTELSLSSGDIMNRHANLE